MGLLRLSFYILNSNQLSQERERMTNTTSLEQELALSVINHNNIAQEIEDGTVAVVTASKPISIIDIWDEEADANGGW